jgi:hypothetical protein
MIESYLEEIRLQEKNQQDLLAQIRLGLSNEIEKEVKTQLRYALSRQRKQPTDGITGANWTMSYETRF